MPTEELGAFVSTMQKNTAKVTNVQNRCISMQYRNCGIFCRGEPDLTDGDDHSDIEIQLNVLLSKEALSSGSNSKSFKFLGSIQGCEVMILVDFGSSHSFVNLKLLPCLQGAYDLHSPVKVQVANGNVARCTKVFNQAVWNIQEYSLSQT
jgi:hypothetical protein